MHILVFSLENIEASTFNELIILKCLVVTYT